MSAKVTEEEDRTERERSFLVFFRFPQYPLLHVALSIIAAVLCISIQLYQQVDFAKMKNNVHQNISINDWPSLIFIVFATQILVKRSFRRSMDLMREIRSEMKQPEELSDADLERSVDTYQFSIPGLLHRMWLVAIVLMVAFGLFQLSITIMENI